MTNSTLNIMMGQFGTLATTLTAIVAYFIYKKTKKDELENAVRIIVLEIKESERIIKNLLDIKNSGNLYPNDLMKVIPLKGWIRYSHLFMKKLNNDEYDQLNDYFKKCEVLEKYIEKNHNFFWITTEERAKINEQTAAKMIYDNQEITPEDFKLKFDTLISSCFTNISSYVPSGIKMQIDRILNSLILVTTTPVWNKLKKIARYDDLLG